MADSTAETDLTAEIEAAFEELRAGRVEEVAQASARILAKRPKHHGALNLAALVALEQGDAEQAVARLEQAVAIRPDEAVYHCNLGAAYRQLHRLPEAIAACREASGLRPSYMNALLNEGGAHFACEQYEQALAAYDAALEAAPQEVEAILHAYRADALRELGRGRAAVEAYERALEIDPACDHAVGNLGMTLLAVGQPERALELCRRATELAPKASMSWTNLGTTLRALGQLQAAMDAYATGYELASDSAPNASSPTDSAPLCTLIGHVWQEVNDTPQAIGWYHKALAIEPDRVDARCGLAAATREAGDPTTAAAQFRDILERHPKHAQARLGLGSALWDDGDAEGAVREHREAVELRPEDAGALARLGGILASSGDVAAANDANREALGINPGCVPALANLAQNLRGELPTADAQQMERLLRAKWPREGPRAALHFGLGYYYDGQKQYDRAAQHIEEANRLQTIFAHERGWQYDPEDYRRHVDQLIEGFSQAFFARTRGMGASSAMPIFIVGMPRSGTTLTEQILASHPRVVGAGERNFAAAGFGRLPAAMGRPDEPPLGSPCLEALSATHIKGVADWHLQQLRQIASKAGVQETDYDRVADKMPDNYSLLGWIATVLPNAKIIHCRRDVRDIALSCWVTQFKQIRWAFDLEHIAERVLQYQRLMEHWRQTLPIPMLEIDYEDTVANQLDQTEKLLDFAGLPWDDRCLNYHQTERLVRTASVTQVRQPIYGRSVERWRHYEKMLEPLLARLA